jgi:hypothetical protein
MPGRDREITIENARLAFRNFGGAEKQYNRAGDRNFCIILEPELAEEMLRLGWNVKNLKPREEDEGDVGAAYIQVAVSYKSKPPRIVMLSERQDGKMSRTPIDEDLVEMLDYSEIKTVDVTLNPYDWAVNGNTGTKAYLKTMFMTINVDPLELKYEKVGMEEGDLD